MAKDLDPSTLYYATTGIRPDFQTCYAVCANGENCVLKTPRTTISASAKTSNLLGYNCYQEEGSRTSGIMKEING